MAYEVKTDKFEGPLDVLLNIIEEKHLSINEISLSGIAEQYFSYIKSLPSVSKKDIASFLNVASTLMLIKSRSLLPTLTVTDEEKESIEDLELRLKELREFRRLSNLLTALASKNEKMFSREAFAGYEFGFYPPKKISSATLHFLAEGLLKRLPLAEVLPEKVVEKVISIEEKTRELLGRITGSMSGEMKSIISSKNKKELVVGFLAILELVKQGILSARQEGSFGEVEISKM